MIFFRKFNWSKIIQKDVILPEKIKIFVKITDYKNQNFANYKINIVVSIYQSVKSEDKTKHRMKKWIQKAIVQKLISYLPFSNRINYLFQKYVTKGVNLTDEYFEDRLSHARKHLESYTKYTNQLFPETSLEIGTGWFPIVPVSFFLAGTTIIYSVDISFLTSKKKIETILRKFVECETNRKLNTYINFQQQRFETIKAILSDYRNLSLKEILTKLNIVYLIEDARTLSLSNNSIDLINSNNTFEHIYTETLIPILEEFKRVLKIEKGVMSHFIDMSDHFAHFDKSINIYNFLQFTDKQWKWIDNSIQPQSRNRIYDYEQIFNKLNMTIAEKSYREGNLKELNSIVLAKKFSENEMKEIAISHCYFVLIMR